MYDSFLEVQEELGSRDRRKVYNNTYLERRSDDAIALRLHSTDVLTFDAEGITYNTGGWRTVTTKDRLNRWGSAAIYSDRSVWYLSKVGMWERTDRTPFFDGIRTDYQGNVLNPLSLEQEKEQGTERNRMRKRISAYIKLVGESLPLDPPGPGDCWYCLMVTNGGDTLGDATGDTGHLDSHMEEGYVVPSLVWSAIKEKGYRSPEVIYQMGGADMIGRAVRRYLTKRLMPDVQAR